MIDERLRHEALSAPAIRHPSALLHSLPAVCLTCLAVLLSVHNATTLEIIRVTPKLNSLILHAQFHLSSCLLISPDRRSTMAICSAESFHPCDLPYILYRTRKGSKGSCAQLVCGHPFTRLLRFSRPVALIKSSVTLPCSCGPCLDTRTILHQRDLYISLVSFPS